MRGRGLCGIRRCGTGVAPEIRYGMGRGNERLL